MNTQKPLNINKKIIERLNKLGTLRLNEPMKNYTTFKTGGPADILIYPEDHNCTREIVLAAREESSPLTVIGGGSNLLVGEKGIRGIVMRLSEDGIVEGTIEVTADGMIYADSIKQKRDFVKFCLNHGFEGMEFIAGIPGCLGGGIIMNAGTNMGNFVDILHEILLLNEDGIITSKKITGEMAGYRQLDVESNAIVLGGFFCLSRFENMEIVKKKIEDNIQERKLKHPLDYPSAGSVFKNPPGHSSWKLIEDSGLKGKKTGGAAVSDIHTNFIINTGKASSSDILNLIDHIKNEVYTRFNILLETEIRMIGEF